MDRDKDSNPILPSGVHIECKYGNYDPEGITASFSQGDKLLKNSKANYTSIQKVTML